MEARPQRNRKPVERLGNLEGDTYRDEEEEDDENQEPMGGASTSKSVSKPKKVAASSTATPAAKSVDPKRSVSKTAEERRGQTIYDLVVAGKTSDLKGFVESILHRWGPESSEEKRIGAKSEMINFIFRSAGSTVDVMSLDEVREQSDPNNNTTPLEAAMLEKGRQVAKDRASAITEDSYPICQEKRPKGFKPQFREAYLAVWDHLIREGSFEVLFDDNYALVDTMSDVLTSLSSHPFRPVRHTAVAGGLRLMLALMERAETTKPELESLQQNLANDVATLAQLESSSTGSKDMKVRGMALVSARDKVKHATETVKIYTTAYTFCKDAVQALFQGIFAHRYRDVCAGIRAEVVDTLSVMLSRYAADNLNNSNLKYAGWLLNDKYADVRDKVVRALIGLFDLPAAYVNNMRDFMNRFRARIVQCCRDIDPTVAANSLQLLRRALSVGYAQNEDMVEAEEAVLSENAQVRAEVGRLLAENLPAFADGDSASVAALFQNSKSEMDMADEEEGAGNGGRRKSMSSKGTAGKAAADKAAAAASAAARRARTQLETIVELGVRLSPTSSSSSSTSSAGDADQENLLPSFSGSSVMEFVASSFWGQPRAQVLHHWDTYRAYLLDGSSSASLEDSAATKQHGGAGAGGGGGDEDIPEHKARLAIHLLHACALRSCGSSTLDSDTVGVPLAPGFTRAGGGSPDSTSAPAGETLLLTTEAVVVEKFRDQMSSGVAPLLPELLAKYGNDAECAAALGAIAQLLQLSTYSMARHQKTYTNTLYQLSRAYQAHSSPTVLSHLAAAMRFLAAGEHARSRDGLVALQKLVSTLSASATRLIAKVLSGDENMDAAAAAGATGGGGGSGKSTKKGGNKKQQQSKKKKGSATTTTMDEDTSVAVDGDNDGDDDCSDAVGAGGRALLLAVVLRRLRILSATLAGTTSSSSVFSFQELEDAEGPLLSSLSSVLTARRDLSSLFEAANSGEASEDMNVSVLSSLCPALAREGMELLLACASTLVHRATAAAAEIHASIPAQIAEVQEIAQVSAAMRDFACRHFISFVRLRHPTIVALANDAANGVAGSAGGDEMIPSQMLQATYSMPADVPSPEKAYILRCRHAGFMCYCVLGVACSAATMRGTVLDSLALHPSDNDATALSLFVNNALPASARDIGMMGIALPAVHAHPPNDDCTPEEEQLEMEEEDEQADIAVKSLANNVTPDASLTLAAREEAKRSMIEIRDEALHRAKALYILRPLAELSMSVPQAERLGHTIGRRIVRDETEAGLPGSEVVKHHVDVVMTRDIPALLAMQLRSMADGVHGLVKIRHRLQEATAAAAEAQDNEMDDHRRTELQAQITSVIKQIVMLIKRQASHLTKSKAAARKPIVKMIITGMQRALKGAPERCAIFGLLSYYLPLLSADYLSFLHTQFDAIIESDEFMTAENRELFTIATDLYRGLESKKKTTPLSGSYKNVPVSELQPWLTVACFVRLLENTSQVNDLAPAALGLSMGLTADAANEGNIDVHSEAAANAASRRRSRGGAARRGNTNDDDDEEEEEEEGDAQQQEDIEEGDDDNDDQGGRTGARGGARARGAADARRVSAGRGGGGAAVGIRGGGGGGGAGGGAKAAVSRSSQRRAAEELEEDDEEEEDEIDEEAEEEEEEDRQQDYANVRGNNNNRNPAFGRRGTLLRNTTTTSSKANLGFVGAGGGGYTGSRSTSVRDVLLSQSQMSSAPGKFGSSLADD